MPPHGSKGLLIAIEGIDGAGKTTQVELLRRALESAGYRAIASKEPTGGQWGMQLRQSAITGRLSLADELDLFIKDRTEHVEELIQPELARGAIVILDRYFYSTIAYQGSRGADPGAIRREMLARFPEPDAVFILDIDPVAGLERIAHGRGETPNEFETLRGLTRARGIFQSMNDRNIRFLDGALPAETIHAEIMREVQKLLPLAPGCATRPSPPPRS